MILALAHVVCFDELLGEESRVVDPAAVDVADVDGTVGAGGEVHGATPFVAAAEELGAVADTRGFEGSTVGLDLVAGDELAGGIGDEDVVFEFGHQVTAIDAKAAAGGVGAGVGIGGGVSDLQRIDACLRTGRGDVFMYLRDAGARIPQHGLVRHDGEHERVAVRAVEMMAVVVEGTAVLAFAAGGGDLAGLGVPFEIRAGDADDLGGCIGGINLAGIEAVVEMHAAIRPPTRGADLELAVLRIEAADEGLDEVGLVVAVGVFEEENLAAGGGDEAAVVGEEALHVVHVVGKGHRLVHAAVAILIGEELDAGKPGIAGIRRAERVVAHVGDEQAAFLIPGGLDGIEHERFGGDELHFIRPIELNALHAFFGRKGFALTIAHRADVAAAAGLDGGPFLFELAERIQLVATHDHLRSFGLKKDFAFGGFAIEGLIDERSVDEVLQRVALRDDFESVPLAAGAFDIVFAAEAHGVTPVFIATTPVDAAFGHGLAWRALFPDFLFIAVEHEFGGERSGDLRAIGELRREHEDVTHAALNDLRLDAGHPGVAVGTVRAVSMEEDAVVLGLLFASTPSLRAPFEFEDEMVVAVVFLRGDIAVAAAADVEGAVLGKGPDVFGIIMEIHLGIHVVLDRAAANDFEEVDLLCYRLGG